MTIQLLAQNLNQLAKDGEYAIYDLPSLRRKYLKKIRLPNTIFTSKTIKDDSDIYAFHHGGRDEMQFNVGREYINGKEWTRYGLCFSLEKSRSLIDPIGTLQKFRKRFDELMENRLAFIDGFKLWYYGGGERHGPYSPQAIPDSWFINGNFICLGKLIKKPYSALEMSDLAEILSGFDTLLPVYKFCVLEIVPPRRIFTRLTSNENFWEKPSGHPWKKLDQGKGNIPFENQYGFGGEEWLLNKRYAIGEYQYGYVRGIANSRHPDTVYEEVHCYTVRKVQSIRKVYYVGYIKDCIVIKNDGPEQSKINKLIKAYENDHIKEVEDVGGDTKWFNKGKLQAVIKFLPRDVHFLEEPIYQPNFPLNKYKRFGAHEIKGQLSNHFDIPFTSPATVFTPGKASQTDCYNRSGKKFSATIQRVHSEIMKALEAYLKPAYTLQKNNIAIETMRFHFNIADLVIEHQLNEISIFEIKTSLSGRRNIREALSQLLDYACHAGSLSVRKLIIVTPAKLTVADKQFCEKLSTILDYDFEYWWYSKNNSKMFLKQF